MQASAPSSGNGIEWAPAATTSASVPGAVSHGEPDRGKSPTSPRSAFRPAVLGLAVGVPVSLIILWLAFRGSLVFRLLTGFPATDATNGFRAFSTAVVGDERIRLHQTWLDTYELEPYLLYQAIRYGWRVREAPVTKRYHRDLGYSKMLPGRDWWRILRPILFLRLGLRS